MDERRGMNYSKAMFTAIFIVSSFWEEDTDMKKECINNARWFLVFDKIFEIICCFFVIVTLYVSMNYITDITLEEQIFLYVFIAAVLSVIVCVGRMHARMIYQIKIEDNEIICYCGCKTKGRKFEKDNLESMVETSDKYILKFCNGKKIWANKKYFRPVIIKDNKSHKGIYPTDFAGVKVENKETRGIIK